MSSNSNETGQCPSEPSIFNNEHQSDIDPLVSFEIMAAATTTATNQPSTTIQLNPIDMVVNIEQENNVTNPRQNAQAEQQQNHRHHHHQQQQQALQQMQRQQNRQEQQRRLSQQQQILQQDLRRIQQQQQQRLRQEAQRERQRRQRQREQQRFQEWLESQNLTYEQWRERQNQEREQRLQERYRRETERDRQRQQEWERKLYLQRQEWEYEQYLQRHSPGFEESIDEILTERQLEQYQLENMTEQERQAMWEQEKLNELERNPASRPCGISTDEFERYATFKEEKWHNDELEQTMNIDEMGKWDRLEQHNRNEEQLIQKKQWEEIEFLYQQLHQPIFYRF